MKFTENTVSGSVRDCTGKPLENIAVTDGRNIVKTASDGSFAMSVFRKCRFVYITVPSGYMTDNFYIPYKKDRREYNFTLDFQKNEKPLFIQISDTEINENGTGEWLLSIKDAIKKYEPAFLIHTGDICYEKGLKRHIKDMNSDTMGCPVHYVIGNHDYVSGKYGEELYESIYGPTWYSFETGNVHFCVTPIHYGDSPSGYNKNDRWKWLENDLENTDENKYIVIFNHSKSPEKDYVFSWNLHRFDLKACNVKAWIFGHYHYNYVYEENGIMNISTARPDSGGIDSSAAGLRLINVDEKGEITARMIYYGGSFEPEGEVFRTKLRGHCLYADTIYEDGFIYTASAGDDIPMDCGIYCIDSSDGKIIWEYKTGNSVKNNFILYKNSLIAMDSAGNVYSLRKKDGALIWKTELEFSYKSLGTSSGLTEKDGSVYCGNPLKIYALNAGNGNIQLCTDRDCGENSPASFVLCNDVLIVSSHWDALIGIDTLSGRELWKNSDEDIRFRSSTPAVCGEDTIITAECDAVMTVDSKTGRIKGKTHLEGFGFAVSGAPALKDGIAYIPTENKGLIAFDIEEKKLLWNCDTGESILFTAPYSGKGSETVESSPVIDGDTLIFGANDGYIYKCDIKDGSIIKKYSAGSAVMGAAGVTEDRIYAGTFDGYLLCFEK